jgi:hypothetical protein
MKKKNNKSHIPKTKNQVKKQSVIERIMEVECWYRQRMGSWNKIIQTIFIKIFDVKRIYRAAKHWDPVSSYLYLISFFLHKQLMAPHNVMSQT